MSVVNARRAEGADLALGVFPVDEPERLAPVEMADDGTVLQIHDKPGHRRWPNSWGIAAWSRTFTDFCSTWDEAREKSSPKEGVLSDAFEAARVAGLKVRAQRFDDGKMMDIGTPQGLRASLALLGERNTAFWR
jgi:glucose-1-phosphate thymidylyltransferase